MYNTILPNFAENLDNGLWLAIILLAIGLILIIKGGDWFVDAAVWMAETFKVPKFLIGATIVSLATTLPEMIVSILAVVGGNYVFAIGNAVGSVTANTGLILAISAIFVSGVIDRKEFGVKAFLIILSCAVLSGFSNLPIREVGSFGIVPSIILMLIFLFYMYEVIKSAKKSGSNDSSVNENDEIINDKKLVIKNVFLFLIGTAGIVLGADLLNTNAEFVAHAIGIPDSIIAVTIVAIGTSLPELITTITSIIKKQAELGVGNIIGANIIDLVLILPICSFICGGNLVVSDMSRFVDMTACLVISLVAVVPALITKKFSKWQGFLMLSLYILYIVLASVLKF